MRAFHNVRSRFALPMKSHSFLTCYHYDVCVQKWSSCFRFNHLVAYSLGRCKSLHLQPHTLALQLR